MNQVPTLENYNAYEVNLPLREALKREGAQWAEDRCRSVGKVVGSAEGMRHAVLSDANPPVLHRYDGVGDPINEVERHPSWHWLVDRTVEFDLHGLTLRESRPSLHTARAAMILCWGELSLPTVCPVSANYSIMPALEAAPELRDRYFKDLTSTDAGSLKFAAASMTERQGGSDVRQTATRADLVADGTYVLTGRKWFVTCPWADLILVLARAEGGLTCFLAETDQPGYRIERLKDKLGWHALGVGEVEMNGVVAHRVGEEGKGVGVIMRMISGTRLDVMLECAASMRTGTLKAVHHARHRQVLGSPLIDLPAMRNVLADIAIESEAATAAALRVAGCFDGEPRPIGRLVLTLMKYWLSKRSSGHAVEAMECIGGNGFVEASGMPRLVRDSTVGSIWEGSGNVASLDIFRTIGRDPEAFEDFVSECNLARGSNATFDDWMDTLPGEVLSSLKAGEVEWTARTLVGRMALVLQASLLIRFAPAAVSDAFCAGRLSSGGAVYGCLPSGVDAGTILGRVLPE